LKVTALLFAMNNGAPQSSGIQPYEHNPNGETWSVYDKPAIPSKKYSRNPKGDTWPAYDKPTIAPKKYAHNPKVFYVKPYLIQPPNSRGQLGHKEM
jgi:hypothetical protein